MKRLISIAVCIVMLAISLVSPAMAAEFSTSGTWDPNNWDLKEVDTFTLGDVNCDGAVNALDALAIREYLVDETVELDTQAADILDMGKINAKDLLILRKSFVDLANLSDYESDAAVDIFTIAGNDISEYCIVVPEGSTTDDNAGNAATQLRRFIYYATGVRLDIVYEQNAAHKISFNLVDENSPMGKQLEIENYIYEVVDGDLNIYGTRRGNLFAIWDILETYLGYRFNSSNYTFGYEVRSTDIAEGTYVFKHPGLDFRHCSQTLGVENAPYHRLARRLNGSQINGFTELRWGTQTGPEFINAHSYGYYWRMATGYVNWDVADKENAGLYGAKYESGIQQNELNWNPCFTDDTEYAILFRGLLETLRYCQTWRTFRAPTSSMSFSICDSSFLCSCTNCRLISSDEYFPKKEVFGQGAGGAGLNVYLANRACRDIVEYYEDRPASWDEEGEEGAYGLAIDDEYPDLSLYTIIYDHTLPTTILPEDNLIIMFCGTACNNHYVGTKDCNGGKNYLGGDPDYDVDSLLAWGEVCKETGAELWYWYYPVTYNSYICDAPNITNIYHDIKFLVEECNVNGVYYEGGGAGYQFEPLKAHLAAQVMWSVEKNEDGSASLMSEDAFHEIIKDYLRLFYGAGYEKVYDYLMMYEAASDAIINDGCEVYCYINNHDRPGDMFSYYYMQENYLTMRGLLEEAYDLADDEEYSDYGNDYTRASQKRRIEYLLVGCDTLGLTANKGWYENGQAGDVNYDTYVENYTWLYNFLDETNMQLWSGNYYELPAELNLDVSPLRAFHDDPAWNNNAWDKVK